MTIISLNYHVINVELPRMNLILWLGANIKHVFTLYKRNYDFQTEIELGATRT